MTMFPARMVTKADNTRQTLPPSSAHSAGWRATPASSSRCARPCSAWLERSSRAAQPTAVRAAFPSVLAGTGTCRGPYRSIRPTSSRFRSPRPRGPISSSTAIKRTPKDAGQQRNQRDGHRPAQDGAARMSCRGAQRRPGAGQPPDRVPLIAGTPRCRRPPAPRRFRDLPGCPGIGAAGQCRVASPGTGRARRRPRGNRTGTGPAA